MALTRPILYEQPAFDATQNCVFTFNVIGGGQVVKNRLTIKNYNTSVQVYQQTITTFSFSHLLPANTLTNGVRYKASLVTYDANNNASVTSNEISFYCYTTPNFFFDNIPFNKTIADSSFNFTVRYTQVQSEPLVQYSFNLYDLVGRQIATSGIKYTNSTTVPFVTGYTFSGLITNTSYRIECTGQTQGGTIISTVLEEFAVSYSSPGYASLALTNNCDGGYIQVQSNITAVIGASFPDPPIYINNNTAIDLSGIGSYVEWEEGYEMGADWTLGLWMFADSVSYGKQIAVLRNAYGDAITISLIQGESKIFVKLVAKSSFSDFGYVTISNEITAPTTGTKINIWIRRVDNIYEIKLATVT